jgi:uncharacterized protein (TIGR03437 family)
MTTPVVLSLNGNVAASPTATGVINFTLSGNATVTALGNATVAGSGSFTLTSLTATTPLVANATFTFAPGDTLAMTVRVPAGVVIPALGDPGSATGNATIIGGTGKYEGATGSFPSLTGTGMATSLTTATIQVNGNGTVTVPAPPPPAINAGGVISASAYGGFAEIAPGSWIEIYGTGLSTTTRSWASADFTNNGLAAPTSLDGVKVTIGGQSAFVAYVSPNQVNALVPSNIGTGPLQLTLTNSRGTTPPYSITVRSLKPGLLAPQSLLTSGRQYVGALLPNSETLRGTPSNPARSGETLVIYGVGFGPVTPEVNAGVVSSALNSLVTKPQFLFGGTPGQVSYFGLAPGFTGLYQFNVEVPAVAANTALPLTFDVGGTAGTQTLFIAVQ